MMRPVHLHCVKYADLTPSEDEVKMSAVTPNPSPTINSEELQLRRLNLEHQKIDLELQKEKHKELQLQLQLKRLCTQNDRAAMLTNSSVSQMSA
ncbi:hypothetical protein PAAG_12195 [Paracoccidioides lutzii Pb01]|uniref:Uncharacterized protein n=1 Tax=Paracoccidioides lutzii (strain ATCC MYA-826 / Pb01) TaxID=502779 RepID=A0A0A2V4B2_PARBA|nr:hypothetical protein PAAG_12195 [Paracoccidioides lutzii Pb01]KGQ01157.1 hypothetical protein PAAG_12195 [Paracoccidioides lutzii Pb01]